MLRKGLVWLFLLLPAAATAQSSGGGISGVSGGVGIDFAVSQTSTPTTTTQPKKGGYSRAIERAMAVQKEKPKEPK